ncbi:MAG TPA: PadR family transcriptional regulator [Longimicrobiales bacterium]|nr:PadR family transcriptional regulator [Longimicrobiales bacterium]
MGEHRPVSDQLFHILLSLVDEPRHGYGIIQEVESRTTGEVTLGAGTLYSAIKRIRAWGWVEEVDAPEAGEDARRRYYGLTAEGLRVVRSEARRLEALVRYARAKDVLAERRT